METIYAYTRAQAIDDGVLFDATEAAAKRGFPYPLALSMGVYTDLCDIPKGDDDTFEARLDSVIDEAATLLRTRAADVHIASAPLIVTMEIGDRPDDEIISACLAVRPGDDGRALVATIYYPSED